MSAVQVLLLVAGVGGIVAVVYMVEKAMWTMLEISQHDDGEGEA